MSRSDLDVLNRKPITVSIGGREFKITPQARKQSRVWKARLFETLNSRGGMESVVASLGAVLGKDHASDPASLAGLASWVLWFAGTGGDEILDTIYDYDPATFTDDDRIFCDDNGSIDEFVAVLSVIVRLVYAPFGALVGAVGLKMGSQTEKPTVVAQE